jgi:TM2 domain-containing membrane protein YozV
MAKKLDLVLLILCIIPFGFDKLYKGSVSMFFLKLLLHFIGIGFIWWAFDIVCVLIGRYKVNPLK